MGAIIVLNDGETFTSAHGCTLTLATLDYEEDELLNGEDVPLAHFIDRDGELTIVITDEGRKRVWVENA